MNYRVRKLDPIVSCFVPICKNTVLMNPTKHFFYVPKSARVQWCAAVNKSNVPKNGSLYICEDHLDLEETLLNFKDWINQKIKRPRLNPHVPNNLRNINGDPTVLPKTKRPRLNPHVFNNIGNINRDPTVLPSTSTVDKEPVPSTQEKVKVTEQLHEGIQCSECSGDIAGFRYTCVQCAHYELCAACEARGAHALHYVLRVPGPRPYKEIQAVVERMRRELMCGMHAVVPAGAGDDQDADSVKVEVKLETEDPGPDPLQVSAEPESMGGEQRPPPNILERALAGIKVEEQEYELDIDVGARSEMLTHTTHRGDGRTPASGRAQPSYAPAAPPPNRKFIEISTSTMTVVGSQKRTNVLQLIPTVCEERPTVQSERLKVPQKRPSVPQESPATKKRAVADAEDAEAVGFQVFTHSRGSKAGSASDAAAQPGTSATFVHKRKAPAKRKKNSSSNK